MSWRTPSAYWRELADSALPPAADAERSPSDGAERLRESDNSASIGVRTLARAPGSGEVSFLCLIGDSRTAKSHLLIGPCTAAAEQGFRVRYTTATRLVNELAEAADNIQIARTIVAVGPNCPA